MQHFIVIACAKDIQNYQKYVATLWEARMTSSLATWKNTKLRNFKEIKVCHEYWGLCSASAYGEKRKLQLHKSSSLLFLSGDFALCAHEIVCCDLTKRVSLFLETKYSFSQRLTISKLPLRNSRRLPPGRQRALFLSLPSGGRGRRVWNIHIHLFFNTAVRFLDPNHNQMGRTRNTIHLSKWKIRFFQ